MLRNLTLLLLPALLLVAPTSSAGAAATTQPVQAPTPDTLRKLYDRVTPSLVAVQYVWESELGRRELNGAGVVVGENGLVMVSLSLFDIPTRSGQYQVPDAQMKEFKIIVPSQTTDADEIDAVFQGRDERTGLAFIRPKSPQNWPVLKFDDAKVNVGDLIVSIGLLPKNAAYKTYLAQGAVSANLRGELPQVLVVGGGLASIGSPVFTPDGKAIGFVNTQPEQQPFLNSDFRSSMIPLQNPPVFFTPVWDFKQSIDDPPRAGELLKLPWIGVPQQAMAGLSKDVAEAMGLKNQPAIELGDIIPNSPAAKGGLKKGMIVVKVNDQPLERGDEPEELPGIFGRKIRRMKVGDKVTFTVMTAKDQPTQDIAVTLEERPQGSNLAKRYYAEDTGFSVRELVFMDSYMRKLPAETKGVVVTLIKPNGSAAAAKLQTNDMITELNGQPIENLADYKKKYESFRKEKPREAIVLVALREGNTQTIRIEPPQ